MKHFLLSIILISFTVSFAQTSQPYSIRMADSQMKRSGVITKWDYPVGLFMESILKVNYKYGEQKYYDYVKNHANTVINTSGKIGASYNFLSFNIDYVCPGMFLMGIYEGEQAAANSDKRYTIALDTLRKQLQSHPRNSHGGFWHKKIYPNQMWLDGIFMGSRFYARYDLKFNEGKNLDDVIHQFTLIHGRTYDTEKQLNYHAWAEYPNDANAFWSIKEEGKFNGCSHEFWSRGIGWYFAAAVDVLEMLPADYTQGRNEIIKIINDIAVGIKRYQDKETGLWYQLTEYDSNTCSNGKCNWLESSSSSMFTYALFKAIRLGAISSGDYLPTAVKAYNGLINNLITTGADGSISLNDVCRSAGLGPASSPQRDGTINYYLTGSDAGDRVSNSLIGVGPFIMASLEYESAMETASINYISTDNDVQLSYDNASKQLNIKNASPRNINVDIYNVSGSKMDSITCTRDFSLALSSYPQGYYIANIDHSEAYKFMIW
jgi:Predicted unsaturated glucuronyl hydrolase involved in regulation of bacterial surface properties, and related proteins